MKKYTSAILSAIIILNLFAGSMLSTWLTVSEKNFHASDFKSYENDDLVLIKISSKVSASAFQKLNDHELIYKKKMYDVVRHFVKEDFHYYYCVNDTKEEKILEQVKQCTESHLDYYNSVSHPALISYKLFTPENFYLSSFPKNLPQSDFINHLYVVRFPQKIFFDKIYPPPEYSFS